jgi:hypothetical protein
MPWRSCGDSSASSTFPGNPMEVSKDFEEFFASCNENGVEYLVVGGYAFALHAHPRYTGDLDVFVGASEANGRRVLGALRDFGFDLEGLTWEDFAVEGKVVQLGYPPLRIDIMTSIDGVGFDGAWQRRVDASYGDQRVHFISKQDLIANKQVSGRKQDKLDLESLT